jgi:pimeloyl-ACP methyl ester carboxylesterase
MTHRLACLLIVLASTAEAQTASPLGSSVETPETLATRTGALYGSLLLPTRGTLVPIVFIHPGSGPTDRDGNNPILPGKNNSLRLLAGGLAARGIATLRVDKRGIGASAAAMTTESALRIETYATDAAGWLTRLRRDPRFDRVIALGHSEGALIVALAAREAAADGYVSVAGAGRRASDLLRWQLQSKLPPPLLAENERILASLERGRPVSTVPPALDALYRPSVQPYLISWFRYDPAAVLRGLGMPVLIVQGTTDLQTDTTEGKALHAARPDAAYLRVQGMNHVLKLVGGGSAQQRPSYSDSTLAVAPALVDGIADFVDSIRRLPPAPGSSPHK